MNFKLRSLRPRDGAKLIGYPAKGYAPSPMVDDQIEAVNARLNI